MPENHYAHEYAITPEWCAEVSAELSKAGMSQAELSRKIGCSPPTLTNILNGTIRTSHLVPYIHKVLGWPAPLLPIQVVRNQDRAKLGEMFDRLPPEAHEYALARIRELAEIWSKKT